MRLTQQRPLFVPEQETGRGVYQSFPTLTRCADGSVLLAFRQGYVTLLEERLMHHGCGGEVFVARSEDEGFAFSTPEPVVAALPGHNEHDALVTALPGGNRVFLVTRSHGPEVFSSFFAWSEDGGRSFAPRQPLRLCEGYGASFGHALPSRDGAGLLFSWYGYDRCAVGLLRPDGTAELRGVIQQGRLRPLGQEPGLPDEETRAGDGSYTFNETSLARLEDGRLLAMIRQQPCYTGLHAAWSEDDGASWSPPRPCGLLGEAPTVLRLRDGRLAVLFRHFPLAADPEGCCAVSVALSEDQGQTWGRPLQLRTYFGGRYHGGYGDLLQSPDGQTLAACYYVCDPGGLPRLEWAELAL